MKKRLTAGILAASYLSIATVTPVMAETGQQTIVDESSKTIDDDVYSEDNYGVLVVATEEGSGPMDVHVTGDVTVDSEVYNDHLAGVAVQSDRNPGHQNTDKPVNNGTDNSVNVTVDGDIELTNESDDVFPSTGDALKIDNRSDSSINVTTGSIVSQSQTDEAVTSGIRNKTDSGRTNITVNGDVISSNDYGATAGILSQTGSPEENGSAATNITVEGDISSSSAYVDSVGALLSGQTENSSTELSISGTITSASDENAATGIDAESVDSSIRVNVGGDVFVYGENNSRGIFTTLDGDHSLTEINIEGSIITGGHNAAGVMIGLSPVADLREDSDSAISIRVGEDISSADVGIMDLDQVNGGQVNILVEGVLISQGPAVVAVKEAAENLNLTVWKIETNDAPIALEGSFEDARIKGEYNETAEKIEKSIQYIIKVDPDQSDLISVDSSKGASTKQEWTNYDGSTSVFDVAHESDRVAVKLNVPAGYTIGKAYSDSEKETSLLRDENGGYYLVVPRGGGVLLSVTLVELPAADDDDDDGGNPPTEKVNTELPITTATDAVILVADANGTAAIIPETVNVTDGVASVIFSENLSSASITSESLSRLLESGLTELKITTSAGDFKLAAETLTELFANHSNLRIIMNGNQLMIFADDAETPVLTLSSVAA